MERDAFSAGVEPGGLHTQREIKLLICYMLSGVREPLPRSAVLDILSGGGMANFFDTSTAIDELIERDHLQENDNGLVTVTEAGRHAAMTLEDQIPLTLRGRSVDAALRLLARQRNERENSAEIAPAADGGWHVICRVGNTSPLLTFTVLVGDELQAMQVRDRFLNDPLLLYQSVIGILSGDATVEHAPERIVIPLS